MKYTRFLIIRLPVIASLLFLLSQCQAVDVLKKIKAVGKKDAKELAEDPNKDVRHDAFRASKGYPKSYDVFRNAEVYAAATASNSRLVIDLSDQRMQLYVGNKVAIDTPCCTGRSGKRTPTGTFKIREKIKDKRSTIFGSLYRNGKKVYGGDRRKYSGRYDKYVGASLPYWMRLTGDGIGIHASKSVKRYPDSAGCVRTPEAVVKLIYAKVARGTKVTVRQ